MPRQPNSLPRTPNEAIQLMRPVLAAMLDFSDTVLPRRSYRYCLKTFSIIKQVGRLIWSCKADSPHCLISARPRLIHHRQPTGLKHTLYAK